MKWTARKSGSVVKPPALSHVSFRNPLVSVYPDFHLLPGPNGQVSWEDKGVWEELLESTPCSEESTHFTISPSSSCCLDSSLLPSNRWSLHLKGPFLLCWTEVLVCCRLLPVTCNNRYILNCNHDHAMKEKKKNRQGAIVRGNFRSLWFIKSTVFCRSHCNLSLVDQALSAWTECWWKNQQLNIYCHFTHQSSSWNK